VSAEESGPYSKAAGENSGKRACGGFTIHGRIHTDKDEVGIIGEETGKLKVAGKTHFDFWSKGEDNEWPRFASSASQVLESPDEVSIGAFLYVFQP